MDDPEAKADELLARIIMIRDELRAGRLSLEQVRAYRDLGKEVEGVIRDMDVAADTTAALALWTRGAQLIETYLAEHFPVPTCH